MMRRAVTKPEASDPRFSIAQAESPLIEELTPAPEAWEVCQKLADRSQLLFLDSANTHPLFGRYSFVTAEPFGWLRSRGREVDWDGPGGRKYFDSADPFRVLADLMAPWHVQTVPGLPPFQGGGAGLFGYDLCHHIERLPRPARDEFGLPDLAVGFYDWVIAFDGSQQRAWIISTGLPEIMPAARAQRARARMEQVRRWLQTGPGALHHDENRSPPPAGSFPVPGLPGVWSNFDHAGYLAAVRRAIDYVHAGDCFQVNVSQRLLHRADWAPLELYNRLRQRNPAPFGGYFDLGDGVLLSASPERFLRVEAGEVETRPIKGTRPRGRTPEEDRRQRDELLRSAKDRAENVMIIDLLRNDLGRVCAYGSVRVPAVCRLETYRTVHHLVSEIRGRLRPGLGPIDLLRAAFPGGSVTGAPKVRAMEIIAELEPTVRGPYCGGLGYLGFDGTMDMSILIRTFTMAQGWLQFPVGGGVVADSTPEGEFVETLHKAEGLLRALRDEPNSEKNGPQERHDNQG
jgi:para-aminobenzoate synthetase component I